MSHRNRRHLGLALSLVIALLSFSLTLSILSCDLSLEGRGSNVTLKFLVHGASSALASTQTGSKLLLPTVNSLTVTLTPQSEGLSSPDTQTVTITPGEKSVPVTFPDIIVGLYEIKAEAKSGSTVLFHQSATLVIGTGKAITLNLVSVDTTQIPIADGSGGTASMPHNGSLTWQIPSGSPILRGAGIRFSGINSDLYIYLQDSDGRLLASNEAISGTTATFPLSVLPPGHKLLVTIYNTNDGSFAPSFSPVYSITYVANNAKVGTAPMDGKLYAFGETVFYATPPSGGNLGGDEVIVGTGIRQSPRWYTSPSGGTEIAFPYTFGFSSNLKLYDAQYTTDNSTIGKIGPAGGVIFEDQGSVINGWRYMEAAPYDQASEIVLVPSSSYPLPLSINTNRAIGEGYDNTTNIVTGVGASAFSYAAKLCADLTLNGYDDWFLPSYDELFGIYTLYTSSVNNLGGFCPHVTGMVGNWVVYARYWSSTLINSNDNAYYYNFYSPGDDGNGGVDNQYYDSGVVHPVRAARRF